MMVWWAFWSSIVKIKSNARSRWLSFRRGYRGVWILCASRIRLCRFLPSVVLLDSFQLKTIPLSLVTSLLFSSLLFSSRLVSSRLKSSSNRSLLSLFPSETFLLLSLSQLPIASPNPLDRADSSLLSYALLTVC